MAKEKKVDIKKVAKENLSAKLLAFLAAEGFIATNDTVDYGFTNGTILVSDTDTDIQIKLITPKAGINRYEVKDAE